MTTHPKYYLSDVPHDLRRRVLDLCFKRLWREGLELLAQNGIHRYNQDDLMNFYSWAPTFLPEPVEVPVGGTSYTSPQSPAPIVGEGQREQSATSLDAPLAPPTTDNEPLTTDDQLRESRQRLLTLLAARANHVSTDTLPPSGNSSAQSSDHPVIHSSTPSAPCPSVSAPPCSPCNPSLLLSDLRDLITRFVVLPEMAAETLALWVVHTYAFTLREVTTYIGVVSPEKRCGKTTLLELLGLLAHEAIAAANISPSALFRVIEEARPTLIIDEADTFMQARDEMAGILNAGYRKGNSYVVRVSETKSRRKPPGGTSYTSLQSTDNPTIPSSGLVRFSCWCPKVMAAIGRLPDTLADRCIVITMQRKMPGEKCDRLRELDAAQYRQRGADFVREHSDAIARARPDIPSALNDRAADIWEPLLAIADIAGGDWPALARHAAEKLSASYDDDITLMGYLLKDLRALMLNSKVDRVLSRDIIRVLNPMHDRPWEDLRRGRDINEWWLGRRLAELGIRSRPIRTGDDVAKGYLLADIEHAFRRYVPNSDLSAAKPQNVAVPN
ncbi:MAG TPA: DUF3631 domain-containing protein [Verrucomicrobiae bacterium]|nr:DUF3631 domain-containing protein [Verrucomicrobiae bacterium]